MATRTIASPGVQINEIDLSIISRPIGLTDVFITGFADQGPTEDFINIGSLSEFEQVYGSPKNAAERYLYHSAKQILLNSPANLLVSRMPYGSGAGEGYSNQYSALVFPIRNQGVGSNIFGVTTITVGTSGSGFTAVPSIEIIGGGAGGANPPVKATARPIMQVVNGLSGIGGIEITNAGYGYVTAPSVQFVGGTPSIPAAATASITQIGQVTNSYETSLSYVLEEPISMLLTEEQYDKLVQNDIRWFSSYSPTINGFNEIGKAGLIILNNSKTTVNNLYEGYYISIADNSEINPATDYKAVTGVKSVNTINGNQTQSYISVPESRLNFSLTQSFSSFGGTSISQTIESYPIGYDFGTRAFNDSLLITLFKINSNQYSQDTVTLDYIVAEGFAGSLYSKRTQNNPGGGTPDSFYIDTVINNSSNNLKVFTNPYISTRGSWISDDGNPTKTIRVSGAAKNLYSIGVYTSDTDFSSKEVGNVPLKLQRILRKIENDDELNIDVVAECGLSTIWTGAKIRSQDPNIEDNRTIFDETYNVNIDSIKITNGSAPTGVVYESYVDVINQFVVLADKTKKDHVFIADPLRYIFVQGENSKASEKQNYIFSTDIYWPLKNIFSSVQSSYVATYGNWLKTNDVVSNKQVWVPNSGYIAAVFAETSQAAFPWSAPAGFNRGTLNNVTDIGVNPTQKHRDLLYKMNVNPIAFFSNDGYVIYGQKTMYRKPSAFDRINVRRLFLTLEKETQALLKYFVFEPNTFATRNRLKGALIPTFDKAKLNDGLYDYQLICDERNNTADVIDNNELKISIYIKPVRTAEFVLADFIATRTGIDFAELNG